MSDGELEEGQTWEGLQCLAHYGLDNVIICVDVNGMQCDGATSDQMPEPINSRAEAFDVKRDCRWAYMDAIDQAINHTDHKGQPLVVLCYTNSAQGIPLLEPRKPKLHYVRFGSEEESQAYQEYLDNWQFEGDATWYNRAQPHAQNLVITRQRGRKRLSYLATQQWQNATSFVMPILIGLARAWLNRTCLGGLEAWHERISTIRPYV